MDKYRAADCQSQSWIKRTLGSPSFLLNVFDCCRIKPLGKKRKEKPNEVTWMIAFKVYRFLKIKVYCLTEHKIWAVTAQQGIKLRDMQPCEAACKHPTLFMKWDSFYQYNLYCVWSCKAFIEHALWLL